MLEWSCKEFPDISPGELYKILQLRVEVFIVEQQCIYQDCDDKDQQSLHLMGWDGSKLAAYARLLPPGLSYPSPSIGRVVISPSSRKDGYGRELMNHAIATVRSVYNTNTIIIGAQLYLKLFYSSLGFRQDSDIYLEDGIEHIKMICT